MVGDKGSVMSGVSFVVLAVVAGSQSHRAPGGIGNASEIDREICTAPSAKAGVNKA